MGAPDASSLKASNDFVHGTNFDNLPTEMLVEVLQKLDPPDLVLASQVHPYWSLVINRVIGFDVQIGPETVSKNSVKIYDHLLPLKMKDAARYGIRSCLVGENFADNPEASALKYPFLLRDISFGGPIWPVFIHNFLVQRVPMNLNRMIIHLNALVAPMEGILSQLFLPRLETLLIEDTGIVVSERKFKPPATRNAVKNLLALLAVHFPRLENFKLNLIKTGSGLTVEEEIGLTRAVFNLLERHRVTLKDLNIRLFKQYPELGNLDLVQQANRASKGGRLTKVNLFFIPEVDNMYAALEPTLVFLRGQRFLQDVTAAGDKVPFGHLSRAITQNSYVNITDIEITKRFIPHWTQPWDPGYSLDCQVFEQCRNLRNLSCKIAPESRSEKIQVYNAECVGVGFYPQVSNMDSLPGSLESLTFESFAIPSTEIAAFLSTSQPNLTELFLLGNWSGEGYGPTEECLKTLLTQKTVEEAILGPFSTTAGLLNGFANGDLDDPSTIRLTEESPFIHLVKNDNGFYECV